MQKANLRKHKAYTAFEITDAFRRAYSSLYFKYIYYELIPTSPGHAKMIVHVKENSRGAFKLGFSYHSWFINCNCHTAGLPTWKYMVGPVCL